MRKLFIFPVFLIFISGCVHILTDDELKTSYNIPNSFRNDNNIKAINDNKSNSSYKNPMEEMAGIFNDDEFHKILNYAKDANPDLLILESKVRQAKYKLKSDTGALFPKINGGLEYSYGENSDGLNGSLSFSWEADIYGKLDALRKSSKELLKYAEENFVNGQVTLAADAASYYFSIRKAAAQLSFSKQKVENYAQIAEIYNELTKAGVIDETELLSVISDYLGEQNVMRHYELELEQNRNALMVLINKDADMDTDAPYNSDLEPIIPKLNDIPSQVILNRPDVRASVYALNSELYIRYNRKMSLLPSLSLNGNIGQILASSTGAGDFIWQIVLSLTAPLINRQELYTALKTQEETVRQAELSLQKTVMSAIGDVENSARSMESSNRALKNTKQILKNAESSFEILKSNRKNGLIDEVTFLNAKNSFLTAYSEYYGSWYDNISSAISLYKAFGGSFSNPAEKEKQ